MVSYSIENKLADYMDMTFMLLIQSFYMKVLMPNKKVEILEIGLLNSHAENASSMCALLSELGMEFEKNCLWN